MLAAGRPSAVQIWRVKAATEVLPLVPVTAAMVPRLARKECRRGQRQRAAGVVHRHEGDAVGQSLGPLFGDNRRGAGGGRLLGEMRAVGLGAGDGDEQEAAA